MNKSVPLPSAVNKIIVGYSKDIPTSVWLELKSFSPEELAALKNCILTAQAKGAPTGKEAADLKVIIGLHEAIENNDIGEFQRFLSEAQNRSVNLDTKTGENNYTLLHAAPFNNTPAFTSLLLKKDANPNRIDMNGDTPTATAVVQGDRKVLALYEHGVRVGEVRITPKTRKDALIKYQAINELSARADMSIQRTTGTKRVHA